MTTPVSASKIDLGLLCLHWSTIELPEDVSGRKAVMGTAFHELVVDGRHTQQLTAEEQAITDARYSGWLKNGAKKLPAQRRHEVAFAINADGRVREIGEKIGREYGTLEPGEIPGSLDVFGEGRAIDLKTGSKRVDAVVSGQLAFASAATGATTVEFHYVSEAGRTTVDAASSDPKRALRLVTDLATRVRDGETNPSPGDHCYEMWCPARTVCKSYPYRKQHTQITEITMSKMSLSEVKKGRVKRPLKMLTYGPEGVGKSTFASQAPEPVFLCAEDGTSQLDVARFPEPKTWQDVLDVPKELTTGQHSFKTLVIDSLDWLQPMMIRHVCETQNMPEEKYHAFGSGEKFAVGHWKTLMAALDDMRDARGVHVVVLAHSSIVRFNNPEGEDFDRYQLALPDKAANLWKQWAEVLLFQSWETLTKAGERKAKGILGDRFLFTQRTAAWDAKNRFSLPPAISIERDNAWQAFADAVRAARPPIAQAQPEPNQATKDTEAA